MFTPNYLIGGTDPSGEGPYSDSVANMIMYYFQNYGSNYYYLYNCQDSAATQNQYASSLSYCQNNYYNTVVYSKGHEWTWGDSNHYEIIPNNYVYDTNGVKDSSTVYSNTGASDRFAFIWHCGTAMAYPSASDGYGWEGMPYDFTHNNGMSTDGYGRADSGWYVYLGFNNYSPEYLDGTGYGSNNYGSFVTYFYMYLLQYHYSVITSLNFATQATTQYGANFGAWPFHTGMWEGSNPQLWSQFVVYGNGNLGIPA